VLARLDPFKKKILPQFRLVALADLKDTTEMRKLGKLRVALPDDSQFPVFPGERAVKK
jgi:hypothetical protein